MNRQFIKMVPFKGRLIRSALRNRLIRSTLLGNWTIRSNSLGNRLMRLAPFGYRRRPLQRIIFNQALPRLGGIGLGGVMMALLGKRLIRPTSFGDRLIQLTPFGYRRRSRILPLLGGVGLGSVMMALMDPVAGKRRRARITPLGYRRRSPILPLLGGLGLGGVVLTLLDPMARERRRTRMRERVMHAMGDTGETFETSARDLGHRARGFAAQAMSGFRKDDMSDDVLAARIRSKIGRLVSHPHEIEVYADQGRVTLAGPVLSHEIERLLNHVWKVRGVRSVINRLESHRRSDYGPGLQNGRRRSGARFDLMQADWSPARRLLSTLGGGALLAYGIGRKDLAGAALGVMGAGLLARGASNKEFTDMIGAGRGRRSVDFQKTINIQAPIDAVYDFWTNLENFPRFMSRVREVVNRGDGVSHWVAEGPGGVPIEWDAMITKFIPNRVLAWKSIPGMGINSAGLIRFERNPDGSTRVNIRVSGKTPMGAVGQGAAELFGADPESEIDADMMRMKHLIEGAYPRYDEGQAMYSGSPAGMLWH
jgi:uncharacterized membrane protein